MPHHSRSDSDAQPASDPPDETVWLRAELERAKQQLAFYAEFDQTIRDNVARSADLLRQAEAARAEADRHAAAARLEGERLRAEREAWQAAVAEQVATVRTGIDGLARLLGRGPAADDATAARGRPTIGGAPRGHGIDAGGVASAAEPEAVAMTIIVHGVPDLRSAQALRGRLASIDALDRVVAREFMAGVARFEAVGRGLSADDLRDWDEAGGPLPVSLRPELVELAYPGTLVG